MDYDGRKAYVRRVECDYFTDAIDYTQVKVLETFDSAAIAEAAAAHGEVRVNRQIVGFKKVKFYTMENVGAGNLSLPEQEMHTTSFWLHFTRPFLDRFPALSPTEILNALTGLGNALRTVASLLLMCDPRDLGIALTEESGIPSTGFEPHLHLYDNFPGGIGQSAPLHAMARQALEGARQLIAQCSCESGCPSCVGPVGEIGERGKPAALEILDLLLSSSSSPPPSPTGAPPF
jgi:DEAD/DEAH box helicase domain-containing protein